VVLLGDPFIFILNLALLGATALLASLPGFTFGEQLRLIRDETMALAFSGTCLATALGVSHLIIDDLNKGMVPLVMSRPVSPSAFVFGKWTGLAGVMGILLLSSGTACLWATRVTHFEQEVEALGISVYLAVIVLTLLGMAVKNYLFRGAYVWQTNLVLTGVFILSFLLLNFFGYNGQSQRAYGYLVDWKSFYAFLFLFLAILVYSAILAMFSMRVNQSMLMIIAIILFFGGLLSQYLIGFVPFVDIQQVLQTVLPNWQIYWLSDWLSDNKAIPAGYVLGAVIHAFGQALFFLLVAVWLFKRKEIKGAMA
jgi:ABC-type transport system involved in multi-copper enzyme maturation permease subunit